MIEFSRKGKDILIAVDTGAKTDKYNGKMEGIWRTFESETVAEIMLRHLRSRHWKEVELAHVKHYDRGWKDAKSKKTKKKRWFSQILGRLAN